MFVASSNVSPAFLGAATKRRNSRDLLQRYFRPRHEISFKPLVDQFATVVNTATREGDRFARHRSVTTGCRVGSQLNPCVGTGKLFVPMFSPKVKSARCRLRYSDRKPICSPQIGHYRLPRWEPVESVRWYGEAFRPNVFAKGKKRAMPSQIFDCGFYFLVDLDLLNTGVALDIKNAIGNEQVVIKFLRAANI